MTQSDLSDLPLFAQGPINEGAGSAQDLPMEPPPPLIQDFGEKIGGARKDLAALRSGGQRGSLQEQQEPKQQRTEEEKLYPWRSKYEITQMETRQGQVVRRNGRWVAWATDAEAADPAFVDGLEAKRILKVIGRGDTCDICKRVGEHLPTVKGGFTSVKEAEAYLAANAAELLRYQFTFPDKAYLSEVVREGRSVRRGPVSPHHFQETFGFRGGEFGNWNMGADGQASLDHAYDALCDLADVLEIDRRGISLDGTLAIAFGARGHGGKNAALAHYEPNYRVINLTKIRGAGSLAHEWWHALDHFLGSRGAKGLGDDGAFLTNGTHPWQTIPTVVRESFHTQVASLSKKTIEVPSDPERHRSARDHLHEQLRWQLRNVVEGVRRASPSSADSLELAGIVDRISSGNPGKATNPPSIRGRPAAFYQSFEAIDELDAFVKARTKRGLHRSTIPCEAQEIAASVCSLMRIDAMIEELKSKPTETRSQRTDYLEEARKIDQRRASPYWTTPIELGARAFESWVFDELVARGLRSDYLVAGVTNESYFGSKPYPSGSERLTFNRGFRRLLEVIREAQVLPSRMELPEHAPGDGPERNVAHAL